MVNVGIVGIGFMGMMHYLAYQNIRGAKVTGIATRDKKKLSGDWRGIKGNFGPPGKKMNLGECGRYADWREMLKDPNIDLIDICLPPDMHADVAVSALNAGKHVICEKPIALSTADGRWMIKAAQSAGKQLLIAQVLPFFPEYDFVLRAVKQGKYGRLLGAHFKRIISDPSWIKDFYDPNKVGGPVVDLHIHDAHFLRLLCGMPKGVFSTGRTRDKVVEFVNTQFLYEDPSLAITASSGVIPQQGREFNHGFEIYLEKATLLYDFSVLDKKPTLSMPLTVLQANGKVVQPKLPQVDAFVAELGEAVRAVQTGKPSEILGGQFAMDALTLCQKETASVLKRKVIKV